jgi:hypothetical protein
MNVEQEVRLYGYLLEDQYHQTDMCPKYRFLGDSPQRERKCGDGKVRD